VKALLRSYAPAAALMLVTVISYVDRNTLALLAPTILSQTHISMQGYGWVVSAYSIAFMVANPLWGRVLDRVGQRIGMCIAVAVWSLASVAHAFAGSAFAFGMARASLGFGEGAAAPGGLRTVTRTLPAERRSRGIALAYSGGSAGAIVTPLLITPIAARWGWHGAFWFTGLLGAAWIAGWLVLSRREDLRDTAPSRSAGTAVAVLVAPSFRDSRVWGFLLGYGLGALPLGFTVYSAALYLGKVLHQPQAAIGAVMWIPPLGSELGIFCWSFVTDRLALVSGRLGAIRKVLPFAALLGLPLAALPHHHDLALSLAQFFAAMFVASAFQLLLISYATEVFSHEHAGYIGGLASGAYGAMLAVLMPLFGRLFDGGRFDVAFAVAAACPVLGYACFLLCTRVGKSPTA
jgi:ACS family hexuronate transporter-like MFS transporter